MWISTSFDYYEIMFFLKYIPGNIYTNTSISNISELIAYVASGFIADRLGIKASFFIGFMLATGGGLLLIFLLDLYLSYIFLVAK